MRILLTLLFALVLAPAAFAEHLPRPDHVLVVIEENRGFSQIMNMAHLDSHINALAKRG
ncbi:MAG: acid phosphatase, partial [Gallionella sp.]|nr:acid phosphatase [Gallionella sp.]